MMRLCAGMSRSRQYPFFSGSAMTLQLPRGPVMVDVAGCSLSDDDRRRLSHPMVGAVILFRRNFESVGQLRSLTEEIRSLRSPHLLIAVDHEGGRVQRFLTGFTRLPPMQVLGALWEKSPEAALDLAHDVGEVLATELRASGVDLSFTPVLDIDHGRCAVIGNRSFHADPNIVATLAEALTRGLVAGGMIACGKHFPGHGAVEGDSHHVIPVDHRSYASIEEADLIPFARLAAAGMHAVMPAHVVYDAVDPLPAGFSPFWLQTVLRERLGFDGTIFSDDLCMEGAAGAGGIAARAQAAFAAGCDMALVCNRPDLADELLAQLDMPVTPELTGRLAAMAGHGEVADWQQKLDGDAFQAKAAKVAALAATAEPSRILAGPAVGESA